MLEGSILQKLRDAHQLGQPGKRSLNFGVYYKNTLVALCHALEDAILANDYSPLMITAFQRGKWYLQEADRYGEISQKSQQVVILAAPESGFAEHPTSQQANVALVGLGQTDPVAQEWHLIIVSPDYTAMVLCQELSEEDYRLTGSPQTDLDRKFYGFWTFEPNLVQETAALAIDHIGQYDAALQTQLTAQLQEIVARSQHEAALCGSPTADHLGSIVSRVVDYLEKGNGSEQQTISQQLLSSDQAVLEDNLLSNELQAYLRVAQLIDQTDLNNPMAAAEVASLAEAMGQLVDLPAWQLHRLRLAGLLHRIAFLTAADSKLTSEAPTRYPDDASRVPLTCPLIPGIQVLRRMQRLRAVATILTHQTEWWNGAGQPSALTGDEIPVESRILGLVSAFQQRLAQLRSTYMQKENALSYEEALAQTLADCKAEEGIRWDPKLVEVLGLLVSAMQQGLSLPVAAPKIAAGLWLLDSHSDEVLLTYEQEEVIR